MVKEGARYLSSSVSVIFWRRLAASGPLQVPRLSRPARARSATAAPQQACCGLHAPLQPRKTVGAGVPGLLGLPCHGCLLALPRRLPWPLAFVQLPRMRGTHHPRLARERAGSRSVPSNAVADCILIPVAACAAGCGQPQQRTEERARRMGAWIHIVAIRGVRGAYAYRVRTHRVRVVCLCPSSRSCSSSAAATGCGEGPPPCTTGWCQKAMQAPNEKIASTSRRSFHRAVI